MMLKETREWNQQRDARTHTSMLNALEQDVIRQRMQGKTLEAVGLTQGRSAERIRQMEAKALRKLSRHKDSPLPEDSEFMPYYRQKRG